MTVPHNNRVALVTGGARRVGKAIVLRLADAGFDVAFTYLTGEQEARDLAEQVQGLGRRCAIISADLTQPAVAAGAIFDAVATQFGRLDVLVNNASLYEPDPLGELDIDRMRPLWAIHMEAPLLLCERFAALLRQSNGHVINMVDVLAERPLPNYLAYSASKAGLWNLTLGLARALAPQVTVNGIAPGVVEWPRDYPQAEQDKYLRRVPLGRAGTPRDVADAVVFLCAPGGYLTGQILRLDGGRSIA